MTHTSAVWLLRRVTIAHTTSTIDRRSRKSKLILVSLKEAWIVSTVNESFKMCAHHVVVRVKESVGSLGHSDVVDRVGIFTEILRSKVS